MPDHPATPETSGFRVHACAETPSTNLLAIEARAHRTAFVADAQTAGRGRRGRVWASAPGKGLWLSVCIAGPPDDLMFAGALAVRSAVLPQVRAALKWPNDVLIDGRKVCGVLVEHRDGWSALGIGLNVSHTQTDFDDAGLENATSLELATGGPWSREALLENVLAQLDALINRGGEAIFDAWRDALALEGREIRRDGLHGRVVGIERSGALRVETAAGTVTLNDGTIDYLDEVNNACCS